MERWWRPAASPTLLVPPHGAFGPCNPALQFTILTECSDCTASHSPSPCIYTSSKTRTARKSWGPMTMELEGLQEAGLHLQLCTDRRMQAGLADRVTACVWTITAPELIKNANRCAHCIICQCPIALHLTEQRLWYAADLICG